MTAACDRDPLTEPELHTRPYQHPHVQQLVAELYTEQLGRYGTADPPEANPDDYRPPDGLFLVAYTGGEPAACGGYRTYEPGTVEIKKMYVRPHLRGHGYGRTVLAALENAAAEAGARRVLLETGVRNTEAIELYTRSGYRRIPGYSAYGASARNRAFERHLDTD